MVRIDGSHLANQPTALQGPRGSSRPDLTGRFRASSTPRSEAWRDLLAGALESRLLRLDRQLASFRWPASDPSTARMTSVEDSIASRVKAELRGGDQARPYHRAFSRGLDPVAPSDLPAGEHSLTFSWGGKSATATIEVADDDTNRDVLTALARAVNRTDLPVQAESFRQTAPDTRVRGLNTVGQVLAVGINGAYDAQDLRISASRHLGRELDLRSVDSPTTQATTGRYDVAANHDAESGRSISRARDPNAELGLAQGKYGFSYDLSDRLSGQLTVVVSDLSRGEILANKDGVYGDASLLGTDPADLLVLPRDATWEDLYQGVAAALRGRDDHLAASVSRVDKPYYDPNLPDGLVSAERIQLEIESLAPKVGERLSLTAPSALAEADNVDSYAAARGLAVPTDSDCQVADIRSALGLAATSRPGSDAAISVEGARRVRNPGLVLEDEGRLGIEVTDSFRPAGAVRVENAPDALSRSTRDLVQAYNDLQLLLASDAGLFTQGFPERWSGEVRDRREDLADAGLRARPGDQTLDFDEAAFRRALAESPDQTRAALFDGLAASWQSLTSQALDGDVSRFIRPATEIQGSLGSLEAALRNEFRSQVTDLLG
ncbi:hypothetical protein [Desulfohalovibrio reitneri]|uniref:hypothetical protein n=1 Tax=Desulfohalovibrio reitneri TaxID=1307759 RepID=UPI0004A766BB|nr:hypothetical protein [Desulfohalovibrio reitneri]